MRIARPLLEQIVAHARRDAPDECAGAIGVRDGAAVSVHALENLAHSPYRFELGYDLYLATEAVEAAGGAVGAIYHSHPKTEPVPSQTDVNWAGAWPGIEWVIVGLGGAEPVVRSFVIEDGRAREVGVQVDP